MMAQVIPIEIRSLFTDAEIAEIESRPVVLNESTKLDAIDLAVGWMNDVQKIDEDRALPSSNRSIWTEHDLAGTLFLRDFLQKALDQLSPSVKSRMEDYVRQTDERFRSYTVDDPAGRMAAVAAVDLATRPWWWRRVPESGPIAEFLTQY